jgi:cysteine synthase A
MYRPWVSEAIRKIESDFHRSADTHLIKLDLPGCPGIPLYLKDESTHPTGSLKHRLARSLFLYGLCNGWINENTTIIEASSGSTAISEAYFARMLGLPFIAVMPRSTSSAKVNQISNYGGRSHFVDNSAQVYTEAQRLAKEHGGHYMDQFTYAERATDWRGNNNIAETIYQQMQSETYPVPRWIVAGAGTGGTSATLGRYIRYRNFDSKLCVVDPENSVFFDYYRQRNPALTSEHGSAIEGIGRPRVEPSFIPEVVDRMIQVPDAASFAAMRFLAGISGRQYGASSGTNLYGVFQLAAEMHRAGQTGSIVTLACDSGERYSDTYYNDGWLADKGYKIKPYLEQLQLFYDTGQWQ